MDSMFTTTPASPQNIQLEDDRNPEKNEVYRNRSAKWASPPPECLSLIFEAGLACVLPEGQFDDETTDDSDLCQYISTITQICRWWRQVAFDTPRLWCILILNDETPLSKLQTWLDRSKAAPLCINLREDYEVSVHIATKLMPLLLQHINHWGRFFFVTTAPWGLADFLGALEGKEAPLLEEFHLYQEQDSDIDIVWQPSPVPARKLFNGPQSVPKLIYVDLWHIPLDWSSSPFRNIRTLSLAWMHNADKPKLGQFMTVLRESPQLMQLTLAGSPVRSDEPTTAFNRSDQTLQPISLPSLAILLISQHFAPDILTLTLRLIHAPNLENLRLINFNSDEGLVGADFSSTIEALGNGVLSSFERLESLELREVSCLSKAAWNLFCTKLTHLRDMTLRHMYHGPIDSENDGDGFDCLLSALLPYRNESGLSPTSGMTDDSRKVECQNLQSLFVSGCSERRVINFARRRLEAGYGLAQVIFGGNYGGPSHEMVQEFSQMRVRLDWYSETGESEEGSDSEEDEDSEAADDGLDS